MTNAAPPDQLAEPAAALAKPKPLGPTVDPLHAMLHFLQTVSGDFCLKITDANAARIFALMRKELPSLERADIVFGAGAASMIATQMRSLRWRLQPSGHAHSPKTPKPAGHP